MTMTTKEVQKAIAASDPVLVFQIECNHLHDEAAVIQNRLYGLAGVIRCFQSITGTSNPNVVDGMVTVVAELEALADKAEYISDHIAELQLPD
jgi:hypothetical protein